MNTRRQVMLKFYENFNGKFERTQDLVGFVPLAQVDKLKHRLSQVLEEFAESTVYGEVLSTSEKR